MPENLSYKQAEEELTKIVSEIEKGDVDVDALAEKVKRATELIRCCRDKLRKTEHEINRALAELKESEPEEVKSQEDIQIFTASKRTPAPDDIEPF